ncbi:MAG: TonB-dependent receptor [Alphaproteobacteria bacterium]|nr:TonB-dependent receptor [Alphaproteobacteria bacterium]
MSNRSLLVISTALAAVFPAFAAADPRGDSDEIVVTASMGPEAAGRLGSAISVIDAAAIAARQTNDLAVLLREVPGLAVSRTGPVGSFTQIRVRGAEANHTLALVDGIEVADPTGSGEFDFANALAFDLDRIEIVRGAQSALYGSDALGGVVNILTRGPEPGYSAYALAEAGSFGTWRGGAAVNAGAERAGLRASVHYARTDGVSAARGGSEADGEDALHLKAKGFVAPADWLAIDGVVHFGDVDVDTDPAPFGLVVDSDDTTKTETLFARGAVRIALGPESYMRASLGYARTKRDVAYRDFFALGTPRETSRLEGARTKSLLELGHGFATGALTHRVGIVAEHEAVTFESANSGGLSFADQDRSTDTASLAGEYRLSIGAHTHLSAGGRLDRNESFEDAATWRLTASQDVDGLGGRLHASYGTGIKEPSFTELYGFFPGSFVGNPDLGPESSRGFDIGWQQRLFGDRVRLDATYFETDLTDEITTVFVGFSSTVVNERGKSERKGVELAANADLGEGLSLEASYTWLDADNADGSAEVRRARNIASAALDWSCLEGRGHLNVALRYNGTQEDDDFSVIPARRVDLDGFLLAAVAARFDLTDRVALTARVEDLLDEAPYEVFGYAEPGRAVFAGLTLKLGGP